MHQDNRRSSLTGNASLHSPAPMRMKRVFLFASIIGSLVVILLAGILSFVLYQNHVNQDNAYNAYLSALSGGGTLVFSDPLREESGSQWGTSTGATGTCQFTGGAYQLKEQSDFFLGCDTSGTYSNVAFEVQMTILQGNCGGIIFRDSNNGAFDYFSICQSGDYDLSRCIYYGTEARLTYGTSLAIHTGLKQQNTIALRAVGGAITLYVNAQQIAQAQDDGNGYTQGSIGLAAYPPGLTDPSEIAFTKARLWTL